jgi:HEAT repeat protein
MLPHVAHPARETVVRRLKAKSVKPQAAAPLIEEFRTQTDPHYKWAVADTLQTVADHTHLDEIIDFAADKRHGMSRAPLLDIVRRSKTEHAIQVLIDALDDPTVTLAAMSALRRTIGSAAAKPHIATLIDDPNDVVRRSARTQLKRIDKSLAR